MTDSFTKFIQHSGDLGEFFINKYIYHHHHHHIVLAARISLTLSRYSSLSFIALGRSSGQQPVSSHSCWMYVRAGRPAFARPCVGIHKSTSLMSSSLLLQQYMYIYVYIGDFFINMHTCTYIYIYIYIYIKKDWPTGRHTGTGWEKRETRRDMKKQRDSDRQRGRNRDRQTDRRWNNLIRSD